MAYETQPKSMLSCKGLPCIRTVKRSESKLRNRRVEIPNNGLHELRLVRLQGIQRPVQLAILQTSSTSDTADGTDDIIDRVAMV